MTDGVHHPPPDPPTGLDPCGLPWGHEQAHYQTFHHPEFESNRGHGQPIRPSSPLFIIQLLVTAVVFIVFVFVLMSLVGSREGRVITRHLGPLL
ncbi:hypothetical protein D8B26_000243 [Coccidioides posadasii str. Silveira]|uniref:Uncharacterized protein n=2 Tax=Coccidioides posadasii TaxID=199306 RepID=E9D832_COCPS|nr:conserved hypothetical protein [Coccidioides posadasii str. Silveira]KMM70809.1 hypothetical protein CPAG_07120 [Coccidioides posadasii RMSCC 3488]QVM05535.1 hypothetical protein D8B26_000243 [Coccidioides posadasii str. Silveira]